MIGNEEPFVEKRDFATCFNENGRPKRWWRTQGLAHAAAQRVSRMNLDGRVRPYECSRCGRWHIGHAKKVEAQVSTKGEILKELVKGEAVDSIELCDRLRRSGIQTNTLTVTSLVWDLQKEQLVDFKERGNGVKTPTQIKLSERGKRIAGTKGETEVPTVAADGPTHAERIEKVMLDAPNKGWTVPELDEALQLKVNHPRQTIDGTMRRDPRFWRRGDGLWTLKIWRDDRDSQPVATIIEARHIEGQNGQVIKSNTQPLNQNEKPATPVDHLRDLPMIKDLMERAQKVEKLAEAARMLEAAGEEELALATLAKTELTAFEGEVVRLVRRIRGEG